MYSVHVRSPNPERAKCICSGLTLDQGGDIMMLIKADHKDDSLVLLKEEVIETVVTPVMAKG